MSISVGSVTPQHPLQPAGGPGGNPMRQVMSGAASLLGMSDAEMKSALHSGTTLGDLADAKGVSRDDLLAAVTKGVESVGPPPGAESVDAATIAQNIIDGKGPGGGPPPGPPPSRGDGRDVQSRVDALTSALGMDQDDLFTALASGTSLSELSSQRGLSSDRLRALLTGPIAVDTAA